MDDTFVITAKGHINVLSTHETTWQITREESLTTKGDCIIGVLASDAATSLPSWLKTHLKSGGAISIKLVVENQFWEGQARGHEKMTLTHTSDMVFRKSSFISPRTVAVDCSFSAADLPRKMVKLLQNPETELNVILTVEGDTQII